MTAKMEPGVVGTTFLIVGSGGTGRVFVMMSYYINPAAHSTLVCKTSFMKDAWGTLLVVSSQTHNARF